jgi:anthranilate phosphoribosyltransferase
VQEILAKIIERKDLDQEEARNAMETIMDGRATPAQIAAFMIALKMKGETADEITGCARAMRSRAAALKVDAPILVDTCGTGGDGSHTFNISTTAAFVIAGAGVHVAKHGNRGVSSKCGSADLLEALGVKIDLEPQRVKDCIEQTGIGFMFAPVFHKAMKHAAAPRKEVGRRTIFNLLGPLTNPAGASHQIIGVYAPRLTELIAEVLQKLGHGRSFVVHGMQGIDEITNTGETLVCELNNGVLNSYSIMPDDLGVSTASLSELSGGTAEGNARITLEILKGEDGPRTDIVLLNAAAAFAAAGKVPSLKDGVSLGREAIKSGAALDKLDALRAFGDGD